VKRSIVLVLGLAALAAPAASASGTPPRLTPIQRIIAQESRGGHVARHAGDEQLSPVERIMSRENARRNDPALIGSGPVGTTVEIVEPDGFHWGDAGIGAAAIVAAMLVLAGATLLARTRRPQRA
jgi:hypothetical protein